MFLQSFNLNFADKIIKQYRKDADKKLAGACRLMVLLVTVVTLLNMIGVFKISAAPLYFTMAISVVNFILPTIFYDVLKKEGSIYRYIIITILIIQSGVLYATLSYHVIIMLIFPLVIACLYNEKKYVIYTMFASVPVMIVSHLVAFQLHIVPDEPLVTLKGVWLYGILPRVIEFWAVGITCYFISDRIQKLINTLAAKNIELYNDQESLILSLSDMIATKSRETGQHVQRVAEYTAVLCKGLGYTDEQTWIVSLASMMHDVGKIIIPSTIIEKPGKLTDEEFLTVKKHVGYGKQMLQNSPGEVMHIAADIAYQHHEKWNGKGYLGFAGEEINEYARCVAIADVFDALVSRRPYKEPWSFSNAYDEIVHQSGEHFDPKLVQIFQEHFEEFKMIMDKYPDEIPQKKEPDLEVEASLFKNLVG